MTSTTSYAGQQMLRQSFTPPASQAIAVSLCGEEALSATGGSRDAPIWISGEDTDTKDEDDDEGQNFDDSQSCTTPTTSIADLDSTGTKHRPSEPEAAIGMDTTPAVFPARVEDDPIWAQESHMDTLADPESNQQHRCQMHRTSDPTVCTDASFDQAWKSIVWIDSEP